MDAIAALIADGEYEHYGLRAHRGSVPVVGGRLPNSRVWIDGECTDEELAGVSTIEVTDTSDLSAIVARLRREYAWGGEPVVLVAGYYGEYGEDSGEIIIRDGICLAVVPNHCKE